MTEAQAIYASTLNLLGSDVLDAEMQDIVDHEHELLVPEFKEVMKGRREAALVASD